MWSCFSLVFLSFVRCLSLSKPERHKLVHPEGTQVLASRYQTSGLSRHHFRFSSGFPDVSFSSMLRREWPAGHGPAGIYVELCKDVDSLPTHACQALPVWFACTRNKSSCYLTACPQTLSQVPYRFYSLGLELSVPAHGHMRDMISSACTVSVLASAAPHITT